MDPLTAVAAAGRRTWAWGVEPGVDQTEEVTGQPAAAKTQEKVGGAVGGLQAALVHDRQQQQGQQKKKNTRR